MLQSKILYNILPESNKYVATANKYVEYDSKIVIILLHLLFWSLDFLRI